MSYRRRRSGTMVRYEYINAINKPKRKLALPWQRQDNPGYRTPLIKYTRKLYEDHADLGIRCEVFRWRGTLRWFYVVGYRNHSFLASKRGYCYSKERAFEVADEFLLKHKIRTLDEKGVARLALFS